MAAFLAIGEYSSDSEESSTNAKQETNTFTHSPFLQKGVTISDIKRKVGVNAAPAVDSQCDELKKTAIDPKAKEVSYNLKYDELFSLEDGSVKTLTNPQKPAKNMLTGYVEPAHVNDFHFDSQQKTFRSYGYALDPSVEVGSPDTYVGNTQQLQEKKGATVFEATKKRQGDKRKKQRATDPSDVEGYLGPWAKYKDEKTVMKPTEEEQIELDEITAKRQKKGKKAEEKSMEEKSTLHIKDAIDYQGRSFLHIPQDVGVNLKSEAPPEKCYIPKKNIHVWTGHTKALSAIRWFPKSGHLLLSCGMDAKIKIWEVYNERRCIRTYLGHKQAVKDVNFNNDGTKFLSAGYDRYIKLWDTETGKCISKYTSRKVPYCVKFNPDEDKQHLFVAGTSDKKIVCWDTNTGEIVQEYDRHLGAVNSITFVDDNRRFVSTSDDKSLRVWEWDIPVDMKYIADPSMHSMPAVTLSPNSKWLACQSMDNRVMIFSARERFKWNRKKVFKSHIVAGYACSVDFSPEMSYLASGDADGKVFVWDWKTTKLFSKFVAHENVCISVLWHPHETSKLVTAGWDGLIKYWD